MITALLETLATVEIPLAQHSHLIGAVLEGQEGAPATVTVSGEPVEYPLLLLASDTLRIVRTAGETVTRLYGTPAQESGTGPAGPQGPPGPQGPAGPAGASGGGGGTPQAALTLLGQGTPQSVAVAESRTLKLTWTRRSVMVAGIVLSGDIAVDAVVLFRAPNQGAELAFDAAVLTRQVQGSGINARTVLLLPEPELITDGQVSVNLNPSTLVTTPTPAALPTGVTLRLQDPDGNTLPGGLGEVTLLGLPVPGVPVVPEPSDPATGGVGGAVPPRGLELVWPASGAPYLHALTYGSADGPGAEYHLPLSPGLPQ